MGDTVRFDDNVSVYHENSDSDCDCSCSEKVGEFRLYSRLERSDYTDEDTGNQRSEWALSQKGFMWPLIVNWEEFNFYYDYFGKQYECWVNHWTELTQNWNRSELDDLGIVAYDPSFSNETKTSLNTTLSASTGSVGVSVDVSFPELKIQSELTDHKLKSTYDYFNSLGGWLAAADEDVELGTVTAFDSLKPDTGDKIAPTYMYARFHGRNWDCSFRSECNLYNNEATEDGSLFNFWYESDIDDL